MILELDDNLAVKVTYEVFDDEVIVSHIELTEGGLVDLFNWFSNEGFGSLTEHIAEKVNEKLLSAYGEDENEDELS